MCDILTGTFVVLHSSVCCKTGNTVTSIKMPSKAYQKRQQRKKQYNENSEVVKSAAHEYYLKFKPKIIRTILDKRKSNRGQVRRHCANVKKKISTDWNYKETNRMRALKTTRRRLEENVEYRDSNRQKALRNTHRRLDQNADYKKIGMQHWLTLTEDWKKMQSTKKEISRQLW